jgi:hypothetical protein
MAPELEENFATKKSCEKTSTKNHILKTTTKLEFTNLFDTKSFFTFNAAQKNSLQVLPVV